MEKNLNKSIKTKQRFYYAYVGLLENTPTLSIKVQQLTNELGLNRITFYNHFSNMELFREQCIYFYIERLYAFVKPLNYKPYEKGFEYDALVQLLNHIAQEKATYKILLNSEKIPEFNKLLLLFFQKKIQKHTEELARINFPGTNVELEIVAWYGVSALFGTVIMWAQSDFRYSPIQLAQSIQNLTPSFK